MAKFLVRNRSVDNQWLSTNRNFSFKKAAALNQWSWVDCVALATRFDSKSEAMAFVKTRVKKPVTIVETT